MAKTQLKGWTKPVIRRDRPEVKIENLTVEGQLPTMIVTIRDTRRRFDMFNRFCHARNIGYEAIDHGVFACAGLPKDLMEFRYQYWVADFWWDHNVRVHGGSGAGENPKRAGKPCRFQPTTKDGAKVLREMAAEDERHSSTHNAQEKKELGIADGPTVLHGSEDIDTAEMQAAQAQKDTELAALKGNVALNGKYRVV